MIVNQSPDTRVANPVDLVAAAGILQNRDIPVDDRFDLVALCFERIHFQRLTDLAEFKEEKNRLLGRIRQLSADVRDVMKQLDEAKKQIGKEQKLNADQEKRIGELQQQLINKVNEVAQQVLEVNELKKNVEKGQKDIDQLNVNIQDQAKTLEELPKLQEELKGAQADNKQVRAKLDAIEAKEKAEKEKAEIARKQTELNEKIAKIRNDFKNQLWTKQTQKRQAVIRAIAGAILIIPGLLGWFDAMDRQQEAKEIANISKLFEKYLKENQDPNEALKKAEKTNDAEQRKISRQREEEYEKNWGEFDRQAALPPVIFD